MSKNTIFGKRIPKLYQYYLITKTSLYLITNLGHWNKNLDNFLTFTKQIKFVIIKF